MPGELLTTLGDSGRTSLPSQVKIRQLATITTSAWSSQKHGKSKSACKEKSLVYQKWNERFSFLLFKYFKNLSGLKSQNFHLELIFEIEKECPVQLHSLGLSEDFMGCFHCGFFFHGKIALNAQQNTVIYNRDCNTRRGL
jgi:hypothetical protein